MKVEVRFKESRQVRYDRVSGETYKLEYPVYDVYLDGHHIAVILYNKHRWVKNGHRWFIEGEEYQSYPSQRAVVAEVVLQTCEVQFAPHRTNDPVA